MTATLPRDPALTRKAVLTFASQLLCQGAGMIAGFVFTPIIITGLGAEAYGVWGFIQKLTGFLGLSNLNSMGVVKLQLGVRQHSPDIQEKRRLLGANVLQWVCLLPLSIAAIALLVACLPRWLAIPADLTTSARLALLIVGCSMILNQLLSLPGAVLAGQNLVYKAMGLNAGVVLLGGGLNALGVLLGYGLLVLAGTSLLGIVVTNLVRYAIARRNVPWLGVSRPRTDEVGSCIRLSVWSALNSLGGMLFSAADAILVGILFGSRAVAVYLTTGALIRFAFGPLQQALASGNSGIGYLAGSAQWIRIERIRQEQLSFAALGMAVLGAITLLFNESFVSLWVGRELYADLRLTGSLALLAFMRQMVNMESISLDAILKLRGKTISTLAWGSVGVALSVPASRLIGMAGMPLALAAASAGQLCTLQWLIQRHTPMRMARYWQAAARPVAAMALAVALTWTLRLHWPLELRHWLSLSIAGAAAAAAVGGGFLAIGIRANVREALSNRVLGFMRARSS